MTTLTINPGEYWRTRSGRIACVHCVNNSVPNYKWYLMYTITDVDEDVLSKDFQFKFSVGPDGRVFPSLDGITRDHENDLISIVEDFSESS